MQAIIKPEETNFRKWTLFVCQQIFSNECVFASHLCTFCCCCCCFHVSEFLWILYFISFLLILPHFTDTKLFSTRCVYAFLVVSFITFDSLSLRHTGTTGTVFPGEENRPFSRFSLKENEYFPVFPCDRICQCAKTNSLKEKACNSKLITFTSSTFFYCTLKCRRRCGKNNQHGKVGEKILILNLLSYKI